MLFIGGNNSLQLMKLLLIILIPLFSFGQLKWTDYDSHYHVSGSIAACTGAAMYIATKKPVLSSFLGFITAFGIGIAKEYIYDKKLGKGQFSELDLEADLKGSLIFSMATAITIHRIEVKQINKENYQNL